MSHVWVLASFINVAKSVSYNEGVGVNVSIQASQDSTAIQIKWINKNNHIIKWILSASIWTISQSSLPLPKDFSIVTALVMSIPLLDFCSLHTLLCKAFSKRSSLSGNIFKNVSLGLQSCIIWNSATYIAHWVPWPWNSCHNCLEPWLTWAAF